MANVNKIDGFPVVEPQLQNTPDNLKRYPMSAPGNERRITMPPEFYELTPEQIVFLHSVAPAVSDRFRKMPPWDSISEGQQHFYRCQAWWTLKGASDPGLAAAKQQHGESPIDEAWDAVCRTHGWRVWHPRTYQELEAEFLPRPVPNIKLILARCPQMAMLHALRGDVSEPYWWAGLSITEHAEPNLSKECSDGYPRFSEAELRYRQKRIKDEGTKPARCTRLASVNPGVCEHCRFRRAVNSPIALGFDNEPRGGRHE